MQASCCAAPSFVEAEAVQLTELAKASLRVCQCRERWSEKRRRCPGRGSAYRKLLDRVSSVLLNTARDSLVEIRLLAVVQDELGHDGAAAAALARDGDVVRVAAKSLCNVGRR